MLARRPNAIAICRKTFPSTMLTYEKVLGCPVMVGQTKSTTATLTSSFTVDIF
jgi:hypothetical protein